MNVLSVGADKVRMIDNLISDLGCVCLQPASICLLLRSQSSLGKVSDSIESKQMLLTLSKYLRKASRSIKVTNILLT